MARMPSYADVERDLGHLFHRGQPQPTFTPRKSSPSQPEVPVSFASEFHRVAAVLEKFGEDAVAILEAVASNPETLALTVAGARIAHLPLTPGTITGAAHGVQAIEQTWKDAHAPRAAAGADGAPQAQAQAQPAQARQAPEAV